MNGPRQFQKKNRQVGFQRWMRLGIALLAVFASVQPCSVMAREPVDAKVAKNADEIGQAQTTFELGRFHIKEVRHTSNETADVTFKLFLALSPTVGQPAMDQLEDWQHRLRDQVIIAVRLSDTKDFSEPSLARLRRIILQRVNRLLKTLAVEEIFLTEFTASTQ